MLKFKHSGSFSDIIYSLPLIRKLGGGDLVIHLYSLEKALKENGYRDGDIDSVYRNRFTQEDFEFVIPLLKRQPYINNAYTADGYQIDYDLDRCKGYLYRKFQGNAVEAYYRLFEQDYTSYQVVQPWLSVDSTTEADVVISRSTRYRSTQANCRPVWEGINAKVNFKQNAVFVGTPAEYSDFNDMGFGVPYRPVENLLDMASVIAGANLFVGNQCLAYSLAQGLGRPTICETRKDVVLQNNECYFKHEAAEYF